MTEKLLQYIWQFQYFNKNELILLGGERLQVIHPGTLNRDQGPDFAQARIKIDETLLAGSVELHIHSSDWIKHKHDGDRNYRNVILHVVWENDLKEIHRLPLLSLQERVPVFLLNQYGDWMEKTGFIPCENSIASVDRLVWEHWIERLVAERLEAKSIRIREFLRNNHQHWEETLWWMLARNFGMKINADAFEAIAQSLPLPLLLKQKHQLHQLEALLFGQAGLLEKTFEESYPRMLQSEYLFLRKKYGLRPILSPIYFLRMRPVNFPTVRLAQLAMLLHKSVNLFSAIKESKSLEELEDLFKVQANDYWHYHYLFDESSNYLPKQLGKQMIHSILINTIAPWFFAYGETMNEPMYKKKSIDWLMEASAEKNHIVSGFQQLGVDCQSAFDSQAILQLKSYYCDQCNCLDCAVGHAVLKAGKLF